jgi:hypothetical protein
MSSSHEEGHGKIKKRSMENLRTHAFQRGHLAADAKFTKTGVLAMPADVLQEVLPEVTLGSVCSSHDMQTPNLDDRVRNDIANALSLLKCL